MVDLDIDKNIPWRYFDGEIQGHPRQCGVGVVLFIYAKHFYNISYDVGHGSNTKA
jgi:ribonuclease HI